MRILILGGMGMLGHALVENLRGQHEVFATVRNVDYYLAKNGILPRQNMHVNVDVLRYSPEMLLIRTRPELVINCIGVLGHLGGEQGDHASMIAVNALFPHRMAEACTKSKIRMIQIGTDCVFSGDIGCYKEQDLANSCSLYGRTKFLGEIAAPNLTIRTSFVGLELSGRKRNLAEWFLSQTGKVEGFQQVFFSGLTTKEFSRVLLEYVIPNPSLNGLYHVAGNKISKFELLFLFKNAFRKEIDIEPSDRIKIDRSLDGSRFETETGYRPPSWEQMVAEMAES